MRILIVEDDKVLSFVLVKMVEKLSCTVIGTATKSETAIQQIIEKEPDLILMDIMLEGDTDGVDTVLELRKRNIQTPVIFATGNSDTHNKSRAAQTDYVDYLIKPISILELENSINKVKK